MKKRCQVCGKQFTLRFSLSKQKTCSHKCGKVIVWKKVQLYWKKKKAGLSTK